MSRLRREDGFAIPTAIWMLVLGLIFCALAMSQAVLGLRKAGGSLSSTRAHAAAEAGVRMAIYHINTLGLDGAALTHVLSAPAALSQCLSLSSASASAPGVISTTTIAAGQGWCAPVTIDVGGGAEASYQLSAIVGCNADIGLPALPSLLTLGTIQDCMKRRIVSTGSADGVERRIYAEANATGTVTISGAPVPAVGDVRLQPARLVPGTFRECARATSGPDPSAGC
jgi:hypothetical protein